MLNVCASEVEYWRRSLQICRVAATILNKLARWADKEWSSYLVVGRGLATPHLIESACYKCSKKPQTRTNVFDRHKQQKMHISFGELTKCKLTFSGSTNYQMVALCQKSISIPLWKWNVYHYLGIGIFVHKGVVSGVPHRHMKRLLRDFSAKVKGGGKISYIRNDNCG